VNQKSSALAPSNRREYERRINRVIDHVQAHLANDLTLERLAGVAVFSPFHFHRIFAAITGGTLSDFIRPSHSPRAGSGRTHAPTKHQCSGDSTSLRFLIGCLRLRERSERISA
jgi:AraC-like DNA-binding protein